MKNTFLILSLMLSSSLMVAQQKMTPELLWKVERLSVMGLDNDGSTIFYEVKTPNIEENDYDSKFYKMPISGGVAVEIKKDDAGVKDKNVSPDGKYKLFHIGIKKTKKFKKPTTSLIPSTNFQNGTRLF